MRADDIRSYASSTKKQCLIRTNAYIKERDDCYDQDLAFVYNGPTKIVYGVG